MEPGGTLRLLSQLVNDAEATPGSAQLVQEWRRIDDVLARSVT